VRDPANRNTRAMVMKNFNRDEVDFTRERQTDRKGMHPMPAPGFAESSQVVCLWLTRTQCLREARTLYYSTINPAKLRPAYGPKAGIAFEIEDA
jgi:hypothetical protein